MSRPLRRTSALGALGALVLGLGVVATASPVAADETCTGTIGARTIDDNVRVLAGASCTLDGTTVLGNVLVGPGAGLTVLGATIDGNIQDDNGRAGNVAVTGSSIGGNIQLEQGTSATVANTRIDGDLQLESNSGQLRANGNNIGGNLQANQNTGGLSIVDNRIDGNLQCQSNSPAPTGSENIVQGSAENQCANMTPTPAPVSASGRVCFDVAGSPGDVAVVNLTPVQAQATGNGLLVSSDVTNPPTASNVNYTPSSTDPNVAMAPIGADGKVCYQNSAQSSVHLVADHLGTIASGTYTNAAPNGAPLRKIDTRSD